MDFEGDGVIDYTGTTFENISHTYASEGIFYPVITVTDNLGNAYSNTAAITVSSKTEMDTLLKAKWEGMKTALTNGDVEGAVGYFHEGSQAKYREIFQLLQNELPNISANMQDTQLIYLKGNIAKYRIRREQEIKGTLQTITYYIYFVRDENGLWKVESF